MRSVTKRDLIDRVVANSKEKRATVRAVVQELLNTVTDELVEGRRIELRDFGVFEPVYRPGKVAQNPKTLERVDVPPKYSVRFKPGRLMKDRVGNGQWAQDKLRDELKQREEAEKAEQSAEPNASDEPEETPIVETVSSRDHVPDAAR